MNRPSATTAFKDSTAGLTRAVSRSALLFVTKIRPAAFLASSPTKPEQLSTAKLRTPRTSLALTLTFVSLPKPPLSSPP